MNSAISAESRGLSAATIAAASHEKVTTGITAAATRSSARSLLSGAASAAVLLTLATAAARRLSAGVNSKSQPKAPRHVDDSMLRPTGASVVYTQALIDGAAKKGETVKVTKDVMKLKNAYTDEKFLDILHANMNEPYMSPLEKVELILANCGKLG